jgi:hypothetical protein
MSESVPNLHTNTASVIPIKEMYDISMRQNAAWGIEGYQVPKQYPDVRKLQEVREGKEKKKAPRELKKQDYLTEAVRYAKDIPGPQYDIVKPWAIENKAKAPPKNVPNRHTYIDLITLEQKRRPMPGPGAYQLRKTDKQIEEETKAMKSKSKKATDERVFYLSECEYASNLVPGPGNFNPRMPTFKPKNNLKMEPQDWRKKHTEEKAKGKKSAMPDCGTYNPQPVEFGTFAKLEATMKDKEKAAPKTKMWGAPGDRFRKAKKDDPNNFPGPGKYNTIAAWNGKAEAGKKSDKKDTNWMNKLSKGIEKSIYYS